MDTDLRKKTDFEKDFFKFIIYAFFGKTMENVIKHRYLKLFLLAIEVKTEIFMNKPVCLGL